MSQSKAQRILVVEDENDIRELITLHLKRDGHQVDECADGTQALAQAASGNYSLLILDWMLPGASGLEIIKEARKKFAVDKCAILMVTAKSSESDIILGLESGADDYIIKPFELSILMARVRALLRRVESKSSAVATDIIKIGELTINSASHEVHCGSEQLSLTPYEFKLLLTLMTYKGRVLTRDKLIEEVQGSGVAVVERAIDTHIFGLRKKLNACSEIIETVRGVGYRVATKN